MSKLKLSKHHFFYISWTIFSCAYFLFVASSLKKIINVSFYYKLCQYIVIFLLGVQLIKAKYSLKNFLLIIFLLVISLLVMNREIMIIILFALCARDIDIEKLLKLDIKLKLFWIISIVLLFSLGLLPNVDGYFYGTYKQSFGFQHPNTLAVTSYMMMMEFLCIKYKKLNISNVILLLIGFVIINLITHSRTTGYSFIVLFSLALISKIYPKIFKFRVLKIIMIILAPILAILTIYLTLQYSSRSEIILSLNKLLSGRIFLQYMNFQKYDITLFGQEFDSTFPYFLDSGYLRALLEFGAVFFILICSLYVMLMVKCLKSEKIELTLLVIFCILLGFAESSFLKIAVNISFVLFFNKVIFKKEKNSEIDILGG